MKKLAFISIMMISLFVAMFDGKPVNAQSTPDLLFVVADKESTTPCTQMFGKLVEVVGNMFPREMKSCNSDLLPVMLGEDKKITDMDTSDFLKVGNKMNANRVIVLKLTETDGPMELVKTLNSDVTTIHVKDNSWKTTNHKNIIPNTDVL